MYTAHLKKYSLDSHEEFNEEPVYYCKECLSLKILAIDNTEFCDDCGSSDILQTNIREWEKLYMNKYNHKFIEYGEE